LRDALIRLLNVGVGRLERIACGFFQLQRLVDETVDRLLAARLLMVAHLDEFLAMRDVEIGDRRAVDEQNDLLCPRGQSNHYHDCKDGEACGKRHQSMPKRAILKRDSPSHELVSVSHLPKMLASPSCPLCSRLHHANSVLRPNRSQGVRTER